MPRANYGFRGPAVLPADASSFGGVVSAGTYAYEQAYGRLTPVIPPGPPTSVSVSSPASASYSVSSTTGFQAGPTVVSGATYTVTASGTVQWMGAGNVSGPGGVDHASNKIVEGFPHEAVIAQIGSGAIFLIGTGTTFTASASGVLYFATNDTARGDNSGSFTVNVQQPGVSGSTSWGAPATAGTGAFSYYLLEYSSDGGVTWTSAGTTASTTFNYTTLTLGQSYLLSVASVSTAGKGVAVISSYTVPAIAPAAPSSLVAVGRDTEVLLSWTAPNSNGAAITDYAVQYSSNAGSSYTTFSHAASPSTSILVTGLTNGTAYVFRAAAVNSAGTGDYSSATASITPATVYLTAENGDFLTTENDDILNW